MTADHDPLAAANPFTPEEIEDRIAWATRVRVGITSGFTGEDVPAGETLRWIVTLRAAEAKSETSAAEHRCPLCAGPADGAEIMARIGAARELAATLRATASTLDTAAVTLTHAVHPVGPLPLRGKDIEAGAIDVLRRRFGVGVRVHYVSLHRAMAAAGLTIAGNESGLPALLSCLGRSSVVQRAGRGFYALAAAE